MHQSFSFLLLLAIFDTLYLMLCCLNSLEDTACVVGTTDCDEGTLIVDVVEVPKRPPVSVLE